MAVAAVLGSVAPALADEPAVRIWYRSSEGCPEGAAFVARLHELGRSAALANVGDQVDFVVTLATRAEQSSGRLERQTARGTVAIRELDAVRCDEVAEALALSLELALSPSAAPPEARATEASSVEVTRALAPEPPRPASTPVDQPPPEPGRSAFAFGVTASIETGSAPGLMSGVLMFAALRPSQTHFTVRATLRGAFGSGDTQSVPFEIGIVVVRTEACPWSRRLGPFGLEPCAGVDLGLVSSKTEGERAGSDAGFWGAGVGHVRVTWPEDSRLALESQIGALVPFVRYRVGEPGGDTLHRAAPIGLQAALGLVWRP